MDDRDMKRIGIVAGLGLLAFLVLSQAYQAGVATGLARDGDGTVVGPHGGFGFFPFPPLLLLVVGGLVFLAWRRRWIGGGPGSTGRGPGSGGPPRMFEEWHRKSHEAEAQQASASSGGTKTTTSGGATTASGSGQPAGVAGGGSAESGSA